MSDSIGVLLQRWQSMPKEERLRRAHEQLEIYARVVRNDIPPQQRPEFRLPPLRNLRF